jgi:hypothetical protein
MDPLFADPYMQTFFSNEIHGWNTSVIYTVQNYFNDKRGKTVIRQTSYKVIFNDPAEETLIASISQKFARGRTAFLADCFEKLEHSFPLEKRPYILIDSHSKTELKRLFIKTHIFPDSDNKMRPIYFLK